MNATKSFLVYKSSAGSGKTFALARTYLALVLSQQDPQYFRKLLAITFTVKAANEMKERILGYLSTFAGRTNARKDATQMLDLLITDTGLSEEELRQRSAVTLTSIIHRYSDFSVMTIDKFVHRLVRSFASDLDLSPDFEVEINQQEVNKLVAQDILNKVGRETGITEMILGHVKSLWADQKSAPVESILENLANNLNSEDFFLRSGDFQGLDTRHVQEIRKTLISIVKEFREEMQGLGQSALELINSRGLTKDHFTQGMRGLPKYFELAVNLDFKALLHPNSTLAKILEEKAYAKKGDPGVLAIQSDLEAVVARIQERLTQWPEVHFYEGVASAIYTMGLVGYMRQSFIEIQQKENVQTLNDFNRILSSKFQGEQAPFIYERLGTRYAHVLIDEFQDTSTLQWQNLLPLVVNGIAEGKSSLIVGDAKQSIYRFKGSEPGQFIQLPKTDTEADALLASSYHETELTTNYRSSETIVRFNNRFFRAFTADMDPTISDLYAHGEQVAASQRPGEVRIHTVEKQDEDSIAAAIAEQMVGRIQTLLQSPEIQPQDIAVLFSKNVDATRMAAALIAVNIPVTSEESLLIAHHPAVKLVVSTLYGALHPEDPFHQQRWLSQLHFNGLLPNGYHECAAQILAGAKGFDAINRQFKWPLRAEIINGRNAFSTVHMLIRHFKLDERDPFLQRLMDIALDFEQSAQYLKESFLSHWESRGTSISIALSGRQTAVRVMTIHKSKGLEYPIVFYALSKVDVQTTRENIWLRNVSEVPGLETVLLPLAALKDSPYQSVYDEEQRLSAFDYTNKLYVAFTRARDRLEVYLAGKDGAPASKELAFLTTWDEWDPERGELIFH